MKTWCCKQLRQNITLTIDSQDIREIYHGKCPYCHQTAKIGKSRPKGKPVTMAATNKLAAQLFPPSMKPIYKNRNNKAEACTAIVVPKKKLLEALEKSSELQTKRLTSWWRK